MFFAGPSCKSGSIFRRDTTVVESQEFRDEVNFAKYINAIAIDYCQELTKRLWMINAESSCMSCTVLDKDVAGEVVKFLPQWLEPKIIKDPMSDSFDILISSDKFYRIFSNLAVESLCDSTKVDWVIDYINYSLSLAKPVINRDDASIIAKKIPVDYRIMRSMSEPHKFTVVVDFEQHEYLVRSYKFKKNEESKLSIPRLKRCKHG